MENSVKTPLLSDKVERNQNRSIPRTENQPRVKYGIVKCSTCGQHLSYQDRDFCIRCPFCSGITAVQPLSTMNCGRCYNTIIFPMNSPAIQCVCGQIYTKNKN